MKSFTLKHLFTFFILIVASLFFIYSTLNYQELKKHRIELLELKSLNRALLVSKEITELNDRVAYEYTQYKDDLLTSMKLAQKYFKINGKNASLEILLKKLNAQRTGFQYDIYMINTDYVIDRTTYEVDLNLDFKALPEVMKILKKLYKDENSLDISIPRNDQFSGTYKNYILQKMYKQKYFIQLSLTVNGTQKIKHFINKIQLESPNLIQSSIYNFYLKTSSKYFIEHIWSQGYQYTSTTKSVRSKKTYDIFMNIFNPTNKIKQENLNTSITDFIHSKQPKSYYTNKDGKYIYKILLPYSSYVSIEDGEYILTLEFDETEFKEELDNLFYIYVLTWFVLFIILSILFYLINIRLIRPIIALQRLMKEKKPLNDKKLFSIKDEISSMGLIYNQLLSDLNREIQSNEELLEEFKVFTANSIHQARTPLSVIKIALEMIQSDNEEALMQIESSLVSIEHLYDTLSYSIIAQSLVFNTKQLNLSQILSKRVNFFNAVALAGDKELVFDIQDEILVNINQIELEFLIDNNLSNALKFSPPHTKIQVALKVNGDEIVLLFRNEGKEIIDTKIIFERYYRNDKSRKGTGIGLSIVDSICRKNKILIHVESSYGINEFRYYFVKM